MWNQSKNVCTTQQLLTHTKLKNIWYSESDFHFSAYFVFISTPCNLKDTKSTTFLCLILIEFFPDSCCRFFFVSFLSLWLIANCYIWTVINCHEHCVLFIIHHMNSMGRHHWIILKCFLNGFVLSSFLNPINVIGNMKWWQFSNDVEFSPSINETTDYKNGKDIQATSAIKKRREKCTHIECQIWLTSVHNFEIQLTSYDRIAREHPSVNPVFFAYVQKIRKPLQLRECTSHI